MNDFVVGASAGAMVVAVICLLMGPHRQIIELKEQFDAQQQELMQARQLLLALPGQCRAWIKRRSILAWQK